MFPSSGHLGDKTKKEDERILQRLDSFSIPVVVSALVTGFAISLFEQSGSLLVKILLFVAVCCELYTTVFLSLVSFHGKQLYNFGSAHNTRVAQFLYTVRNVTAICTVTYSVGLFAFFIAFLSEAFDTLHVPLEVSLPVGIVFILVTLISWKFVHANAVNNVFIDGDGEGWYPMRISDLEWHDLRSRRSSDLITSPTTFLGWWYRACCPHPANDPNRRCS